MSEQIDWVGPPKRGRGRPKGERPPLSSAERMRRLRERAATALYAPEAERDGQALADLSDTALCELVREPLKAGRPFALADVMVELVHRANARQGEKHPDREPVRLARWAAGAGWVEWEDSRSVTPIQEEPEPGEKTPGRAWEYPPEIKAKAVRWKRKGMKHAEICSRIQAECGRAPGVANMPKLLKNWAVDPAVLAILDQEGA